MDFTREPIIETIITPKEGYKLVVKNSKSENQEDYFVDSVEIVSFSGTPFYRSLERPKAFLFPVSDYEITEVRETRMVLKTPSSDRSIKIGGGRDGGSKAAREHDKGEEHVKAHPEPKKEESQVAPAEGDEDGKIDPRLEKKRDRRRQSRKRRGRDEPLKEGQVESAPQEGESVSEPAFSENGNEGELAPIVTPSMFSALLQPPTTLISETINRYRENDLFKGAFYLTEEEQYKPHDKVDELLRDEEESVVPHVEADHVQHEAGEQITQEPQQAESFPGEHHEQVHQEQAIDQYQDEEITPEVSPEEAFKESETVEMALPLFAEEEKVNEDQVEPVNGEENQPLESEDASPEEAQELLKGQPEEHS